MTSVPVPADVFDELRVVTSVRWLPADLASAGVIPVVADLGLDVPARTARTAWWCSGAFAARLRATGVTPAFAGPPARWQAGLPERLWGRTVAAMTLADVPGVFTKQTAAFAKVADVKLAAVPAQWWATLDQFTQAAHAAGVPGSTPVLVSPTFVDFASEYRCFVADGEVVAASLYREGERTWDSWETGSQPPAGHAVGFAEKVVRDVGDQPRGWVLDVGQTVRGDWVIVEANPAWCANPYHCDPQGVIRSVLASQDPDPAQRRWAWEPGDVLSGRARPLPVRS